MKATLKKIEDTAHSIKTFWFEPERKIEHQAGQFVELVLPHDDSDKRGIKRWFTLSSAPSEELVAITTKFAEKGSTFKQALLALQPGDSINMSDPMGDFVLPKNKQTPVVMAAGGIGITPMRSMLKQSSSDDASRNITLFYGVNDPAEVAFKDDLKSAANVRIVLSDPSPSWTGLKGRVTADMLTQDQPSEAIYYIAGPEPMVEALGKDLKNQGIKSSRIVSDFFPGYA